MDFSTVTKFLSTLPKWAKYACSILIAAIAAIVLMFSTSSCGMVKGVKFERKSVVERKDTTHIQVMSSKVISSSKEKFYTYGY